MKKVYIQGKGKVYLCLYAKRHIRQNEELQNDYGVKDLPWRKKGKYLELSVG
jgi:SET domain-containing protein